ncbi:hypothetical protein [Enterovirga rhinocerotis]|nr:hypothetical protein [Enterovirga rhinocerotis]
MASPSIRSRTGATWSWRAPIAVASIAVGLSACSHAVPIRDVVSPADVSSCRRLGEVGITRTDGIAPRGLAHLTTPVRVHARPGEATPAEISGPNFGATLDHMRESAYALGATDLLLSRRIYRDWSYVAGVAYRCSR